jgi:hypothetical protein
VNAVDRVLRALGAARSDAYRCTETRAGAWRAWRPLCQRGSDSTYRRLSVTERRGEVHLHCEAGCSSRSIIARLALDERQFKTSERGEMFASIAALARHEFEELRQVQQIVRVVQRDVAA